MTITYTSTTSTIYAGITAPALKTAHIFLESGQSNNQGVAPYSESPILSGVNIGNIKTWRRGVGSGSTMYSGSGQWMPLNYETNQYEGRNQFGSILKFAMNLRDNLESENDEIYMIKADGNGKPIVGWVTTSGNEYKGMYEGHIAPALANLVANQDIDVIKIHGFFWDQGEADCDTSAEANAYQSRLTTLINQIRSYVGISDLPFILRRTESSYPNYTYISTVRSAQEAVADADSNVEIITSETVGGYMYVGDQVHLDGSTQNAVGDARYSIITSMTSGSVYNG